MANEQEGTLTAAAAARQQSMLPVLLGVVRRRRRRRRAVRGVAALAAVMLVVGYWPRAVAPSVPTGEPGTTLAWSVVGDDASVVARCEIATIERAEWYLDDDGLQAWLSKAARPAWLVRCNGQVRVDPRAIDARPEPELAP